MSGVNGHDDTFILNDIRLRIPPTAIKISKDSLNHQWQTLRTNTSQKTKSGHSTATIEFTAAFVSHDDIHLKLKPLIAQLRYMPFCFAENQFLRENLFPQEAQDNTTTSTSSTIVLAFRAASITARPDTPGTIWVNFQFAYFNYLPYTPYWQYKIDLFGDDSFKSTTFPEQSKAWKKFVAPVVNKHTTSEAPKGKAMIKFLELRTAPTSSTQTISETKDLLTAIGNDQGKFFDAFRSVKAETPEEAILLAARGAFSQFKNLKSVAGSDALGPLLVNAGPNSNPLSKRFRADGQFVDQANMKRAFAELDQRYDQRKLIEPSDDADENDVFKLIDTLQFQDNRGAGYGVFKKLRSLPLDADEGIILESITISIQNILASIPLIGQRYATFQHIGSIDASVILDMKVMNDTSMESISWFYDTANDNALNNRHIPQGLQTIKVDNEVLALFNLQEFITQDMESSTIEGSPGTYNVRLSLMESGLKTNDKLDQPDEKFALEFASQDFKVAKEIVRIITNNLNTTANTDGVFFTSTVNSSRSARFANLVQQYIGMTTVEHAGVNEANKEVLKLPEFALARGARDLFKTDTIKNSSNTALNKFADDVAKIIFDAKLVAREGEFVDSLDSPGSVLKYDKPGDLNLFNALMALTEDDVPGITKVQEYIYSRSKRESLLNKDMIQLVNKPLSDVLLQAKNKTKKGAEIDAVRRQKALYQRINFDTTADTGVIESAVGLSENPPSTIEGKKFDDLLNNSTESLLKLQPFVKWNEFVSSLTTAIIESNDINLAEFASAKKLVNDLQLGKGLPAYQDFQLETLIPVAERNDINALLSLDPDCYLLTPLATLDNFIDPALIANAKRIAQASSKSALTQINKFYKDSWFPSFISDFIQDRIRDNLGATTKEHGTDNSKQVGKPIDADHYYDNATKGGLYSNAGSGNRNINLGQQIIDSKQIHSSQTTLGTLTSQRTLNHSLNPDDLFTSFPTAAGPAPITAPKKTSKKAKATGRLATKSQQGADGVVSDSPQQLAASCGADLDTYAIARCIASEDGSANEATKIAVGWAIKNAAYSHHKTVAEHLLRANYKPGFFGHGGGRDAATNRDPSDDDLRIAKLIFANAIPDPTDGATQWSHTQAQNSLTYAAAVQKLAIAQGRDANVKAKRVLPQSELIAQRAAEGRMVVNVAGTDPNHIIFFKKTGKRSPAYTPPTPATPIPDTGINSGQNVADLSIQAFESSIENGQAMRMVRAFPAFKLYFIQDNSGNRRRFGLDDFYSYNSVVDITCVRSRKIPADLLEVTLTNVSGVLSNRKFQGPRNNDGHTGEDISAKPIGKDGKPMQQDPNGFLKKNSNQNNTLASLMLQAGIDIELRLGYVNDPDKLTTVFDGKIMEVEFSDSDDLVRIICQSHAIELVQDMKGMAEPIEKSGYFISDARTDLLLESLMAQPEVVHFGRWVRSKTVTDGNTNRYLLTNKFKLQPSPQDDNIFVPSIEILRNLDPGFLFSDLKYSIYQTTIWDVFDEMTLRHPGYIKSAVPYKDKSGPRMTMFFGLPSQLYFASDPSNEEKNAGETLRAAVNEYNSNTEQLKKSVGVINPDLFNVVETSVNKENPNINTNKHLELKPGALDRDFDAERLRLAKDFQSVRPFRSYHLVTSKHHIISNNIRASAKGTHNTVSVQYGDCKFNKDTKELVQEGTNILTLGVDAAMPDEEVKELFIQYPNCQTVEMAKNYALGYLIRELKEVYRGELTVIGNPEIKPYDMVTIFDDYSDIMGSVEVEQVIHRFSQDTGFITEITPDLFVTANEWVNMTANDMMSIIMEGAASTLNHGTATTTESIVTNPAVKAGTLVAVGVGLAASPLIAIIGAGAAIGGYFMMQKMVDFSSHGQPVVINPLIHRGKPFIAGLPIAKLNNLWSTNKGEWFKEAFDGLGLWWDDFGDKLVLAANQGSALNLFSGDSIGPKF